MTERPTMEEFTNALNTNWSTVFDLSQLRVHIDMARQCGADVSKLEREIEALEERDIRETKELLDMFRCAIEDK